MQYRNRQSYNDFHHQQTDSMNVMDEIFEEDKEALTSTNSFNTINTKTKFIDRTLPSECVLEKKPGTFNYMFFVISGSLELKASFAENKNQIGTGKFFIISCDQECSITVCRKAHLVILKFNSVVFDYGVSFFQELGEEKVEPYEFTILPISNNLNDFLCFVSNWLEKGIESHHFHKYSHGLLNVILRKSYSKEDLIKIYYNIVGKKIDFRSKVLQTYPKAHNVKELAVMMDMSRSAFVRSFMEEFGTNAKSWLAEKKKEFIRLNLSDPGISVKSLMFRCGFDTPSNFTRYFQQNFKCTPSYAIKNKEEFISPVYYLKNVNAQNMAKKMIIDI